MREWLLRTVARLMNRVRVNSLQKMTRNGGPVFVKRRRGGARLVIWLGNQFLAAARGGAQMFGRADEWVQWEVHCAGLLYPDSRQVTVESRRGIVVTAIRGASLRQLLQRDQLDPAAIVATARELQRVHRILCNEYHSAWSHGDLHLDNLIYDPGSNRTELIDFDTRHVWELGPIQRHADDLKIMLLELVSSPIPNWQELATTLVETYDDRSVMDELQRQLVIPTGLARILFYTRVHCCAIYGIEQRLHDLRETVGRTSAKLAYIQFGPEK